MGVARSRQEGTSPSPDEADGKSGDAAGSKAEAAPAKIALSRMHLLTEIAIKL